MTLVAYLGLLAGTPYVGAWAGKVGLRGAVLRSPRWRSSWRCWFP